MSIEQPLDPQLIEQTKQQIRSLVAEIARLSKTEVAPEEFYGEFLSRVVSALAAVGGAVWALNPEGQLALQYQINLQEAQLRQDETVQAQHARLLYKALGSSEGMLVPPHSGPGQSEAIDQFEGETPAANPTAFLLVLGQLKTDLETVGVVEIFQRADSGPSTQQGYLRFLVADVRAGRRFPQEPSAPPFLPSADAVDPVGGFHPRGPRFARTAGNRLHHCQ